MRQKKVSFLLLLSSCFSQPATRNPQPETRNPQLATRNPQPATRNPQLSSPQTTKGTKAFVLFL
ncbi:MAG: hypothetical protein C0512_10335 [Flavobacterium sp.]|nr:hypothetical protein [Flavobacterium sp.]